MSKLAIIAIMSLLVSIGLCYSTLWIAERIAEATMLRTEITLNP